MIQGKKLVVVMPAYNAAKTLRSTHEEVLTQGVVDRVIVVDDDSADETVRIARTLQQTRVEVHPSNRGYGANQKTLYRLALDEGADIVVMVHPDYQYTPRLIPALAGLVASGLYPCVLASRILGGSALAGGMPWWKYVSNRALTFAENLLLGSNLSEFHTGYRAWSRELLEALPMERNSDDFVFDNQILAQTFVARVHHRRGIVPDEVLSRGVVDRLSTQREVRARLPEHRAHVPTGKDGAHAFTHAAAGIAGQRSARLTHRRERLRDPALDDPRP